MFYDCVLNLRFIASSNISSTVTNMPIGKDAIMSLVEEADEV